MQLTYDVSSDCADCWAVPLPRASSPDCVLCSFRQGHTLVRLLGYSQGLTGSCNSTALSTLLYARAEEPLHNTAAIILASGRGQDSNCMLIAYGH